MKEKSKKKTAIETVFIYLISERIYFWWGICDRYTDERKVCGSIPLDRGGRNAGSGGHRPVLPRRHRGKRRHCRGIQAGRHSRRNHSQRRHDPSALFYHFPDFRFLHRFPGKFHCQPDALRYAGGRWRRHRLRCLGYGLRHNRRESTPSLLIMAGAFLATCFFNVNVVYVVIVCGLIGVARTFLEKRKERK